MSGKVRRHLDDEQGEVDTAQIGRERHRGQLWMRRAIDGNLVAQRAAGGDVFVDGGHAPRPRIHRDHEQELHRASPPRMRGGAGAELLPGPAHRLRQSSFESRPRLPAEHGPRLANVRLHRALLARPRGGADHLVAAGRVAERGDDGLGELVDRQRPPAAEVEDAAGRGRRVQCPHPPLDDVVDEDEVARLLAVAEDGDRLATQEVARENAQHTLIRIAEGLARPVDAEHPQRGHAEIETEVWPLRRRVDVALGRLLGDPVIGVRAGGLGLGRRERFGSPRTASSSWHRSAGGPCTSGTAGELFKVPSTLVRRSATGSEKARMIETWPAIWQTASNPRANAGSTSAGTRHVATQILGSRRHVLAPAVGLVVHHRHGVSLGEQATAQVRADEPGPTGHENSHPSHPFRLRTLGTCEVRSPACGGPGSATRR